MRLLYLLQLLLFLMGHAFTWATEADGSSSDPRPPAPAVQLRVHTNTNAATTIAEVESHLQALTTGSSVQGSTPNSGGSAHYDITLDGEATADIIDTTSQLPGVGTVKTRQATPEVRSSNVAETRKYLATPKDPGNYDEAIQTFEYIKTVVKDKDRLVLADRPACVSGKKEVLFYSGLILDDAGAELLRQHAGIGKIWLDNLKMDRGDYRAEDQSRSVHPVDKVAKLDKRGNTWVKQEGAPVDLKVVSQPQGATIDHLTRYVYPKVQEMVFLSTSLTAVS
ncbi:hypothetical protein M011DRAFT_92730 [Sporormia fimetaria CBS 119925]|uniref:Uncharacterized protein n=1 Tax=Sporormia fimetaria CBS 119925 TaxID=1340428 RepID=A0A6A6V8C8_9PLEO|nr:hypothetical protein M011DRAFT_92730 [Sporormia fimetaria CBS 119925]